jgi:pantoate--beta-alanine ligase
MTKLGVVRSIPALREAVAGWRKNGETVALVPTMGALHDGHAALVTHARALAQRVIATIFVNPTQFNAAADLAAYPRTEAADMGKLTAVGADLLFAPTADVMYPAGYATTVTVAGLTDVLCGAHRPGHFAGVATIVTKLLLQALPDVALFGEKDFQQLMVIKRLTADLDIPVRIVGVPTVREKDGLAMSSRNAYLTAAERAAAPKLHAAIAGAANAISRGGNIEQALSTARDEILRAGFKSVDYVDARAESDLRALTHSNEKARVFAAAHLGKARLIDNVPINLA